MHIREFVDMAIDEDRRAPCLWVPAEHFDALCEALQRKPNVIGAIIYRGKTIRAGEPYSDITTRAPWRSGLAE